MKLTKQKLMQQIKSTGSFIIDHLEIDDVDDFVTTVDE